MSADYDAYGIPMRPVGERLDDLIDAIELMRGLWSNEKFTFEGKNVRVTDAVCDPKPVRGTIPIWTGAGKPRGLRIVGRLADGWIKNRGWASLEEISGMIAIAQKSALRVGRDPDSIRCVLGGTGFVASNPAEAADFQAQNPPGGNDGRDSDEDSFLPQGGDRHLPGSTGGNRRCRADRAIWQGDHPRG